VEYWNRRPQNQLSVSLVAHRQDSVAFSSISIDETGWYGRPLPAGLFRSTCQIPGDLLNSDRYSFQIYLVDKEYSVQYTMKDAIVFDVADVRPPRCTWQGNWRGSLRPMLNWRTEPLADEMTDLSATPTLSGC
jgi:lipopolysaccharide transport system ATP-binding protein